MKEIASCLFPSMVVAIDDNLQLLNTVNLGVTKQLPCKLFRDSSKALDYLNQLKLPDFIDRCILRTEEDTLDAKRIDINIAAIQEEVYHAERFEHVSVLVVDYAMPNLNGADLCRKLEGSPYKIILLTGEAGSDVAIELFNEGIIHRYLHKSRTDYINKLVDMIFELQKQYFHDLSSVVIQSITRRSEIFENIPSCLEDAAFIDFFQRFLKDNNLVEYYLVDESGSFLLLDADANLSWLAVKHAGDMEAADEEANLPNSTLTPENRKRILSRELLVHFFDHGAEINTAAEWDTVLYPATTFEGKHATYYYSHIKKPKQPTGIDQSRIVSFNQYVERTKTANSTF